MSVVESDRKNPDESVVAKCIADGLVGGEGFSIDASLIRVDAGKKKRYRAIRQ
jgi:hypothetical protein